MHLSSLNASRGTVLSDLMMPSILSEIIPCYLIPTSRWIKWRHSLMVAKKRFIYKISAFCLKMLQQWKKRVTFTRKKKKLNTKFTLKAWIIIFTIHVFKSSPVQYLRLENYDLKIKKPLMIFCQWFKTVLYIFLWDEFSTTQSRHSKTHKHSQL